MSGVKWLSLRNSQAVTAYCLSLQLSMLSAASYRLFLKSKYYTTFCLSDKSAKNPEGQLFLCFLVLHLNGLCISDHLFLFSSTPQRWHMMVWWWWPRPSETCVGRRWTFLDGEMLVTVSPTPPPRGIRALTWSVLSNRWERRNRGGIKKKCRMYAYLPQTKG